MTFEAPVAAEPAKMPIEPQDENVRAANQHVRAAEMGSVPTPTRNEIKAETDEAKRYRSLRFLSNMYKGNFCFHMFLCFKSILPHPSPPT